VLALSAASTVHAQWIQHEPKNHGVIVFVHGITGDAQSTWTAASGAYWPKMLTQDAVFNGEDIYVYNYPSPRLDRAFTIDELADNMRLVLSTDGVLQHNELTFVFNSMGDCDSRLHYQISERGWSKNPDVIFFLPRRLPAPHTR
jgi:hypothetical protein